MAYATYSDCVTRYPILEKWPGLSTQVNSTLIHFGEIELNSRLAPKFDVPFDPAPEVIRDLAIDFTYMKSLLYGNNTERWIEVSSALGLRIERLLDGDDMLVTDSGTVIEPVTRSGVDIWSSTEDYYPTHSMLGAESPCEGISSDYLKYLRNERGCI
jgi:hypothetical protein